MCAYCGTSLITTMLIMFLSVSFNNHAAEPVIQGWQYQQSTMGEGLPTYQVSAKTIDNTFEMQIEIAPDSDCDVQFHLFPHLENLEVQKVGKVLIRFSVKKTFPLKGHRVNKRTIQLLNLYEPDTTRFIDYLASEKYFDLLFQLNGKKYFKKISTEGAYESIQVAQNTCFEEYFKDNLFVVPHSSKKPLQKNEVRYLPTLLLRIARNEIFARHGYIFKSEDLRRHFARFDWYKPTTEDIKLSDIEKENVGLISYIERLRKDDKAPTGRRNSR